MEDLFVADCEGAVAAELRSHGLALTDRREGDGDPWLRARLGASDIELLVYADEVAIEGPRTDLLFETSEYPSTADLIGEVVLAVRFLAQEGRLGPARRC